MGFNLLAYNVIERRPNTAGGLWSNGNISHFDNNVSDMFQGVLIDRMF